MTCYIYLSSDARLPTGGICNDETLTNEPAVYFALKTVESFFFENNFDEEKQCNFSYSPHFSEAKYQVASIDLYLPEDHHKKLSQKNKKALHELFNYIISHFKKTDATYVEVLYCLNSLEDRPLRQEKLISHQKLSVDDLYYEESKFLRIEEQMTDFLFRGELHEIA